MKRMLATAGAVTIAVIMLSGGVASAMPFYSQYNPAPYGTQRDEGSQMIPWHYVWQYHYGHDGQWVPGWVATLNYVQ
jgi:hypothetical protein